MVEYGEKTHSTHFVIYVSNGSSDRWQYLTTQVEPRLARSRLIECIRNILGDRMKELSNKQKYRHTVPQRIEEPRTGASELLSSLLFVMNV